ncbi:hypothetical protein POKO110462_04015 [Pontibacter korlensis]
MLSKIGSNVVSRAAIVSYQHTRQSTVLYSWQECIGLRWLQNTNTIATQNRTTLNTYNCFGRSFSYSVHCLVRARSPH